MYQIIIAKLKKTKAVKDSKFFNTNYKNRFFMHGYAQHKVSAKHVRNLFYCKTVKNVLLLRKQKLSINLKQKISSLFSDHIKILKKWNSIDKKEQSFGIFRGKQSSSIGVGFYSSKFKNKSQIQNKYQNSNFFRRKKYKKIESFLYKSVYRKIRKRLKKTTFYW